jgi:coenzyme F420-reducing hydrogenase delta subunit
MGATYEPKILAFLCNWCAYAGADLAGVSRFQYPPTIRVIRTMCSGRVDPLYVVEGLRNGYDGVFVFGCHLGDCHYLDGNVYTSKRMPVVEHLLDLAGIGRSRLQLRWVSAAEGQLFASYVTELTELIGNLGPFRPDAFQLSLAAVEGVLKSPRIRWLMGMDRKITEEENSYHQRVDPEMYRAVVKQALGQEYQRALIFEVLGDGPHSVREMASKTGLPVYTVSLRLNDLERMGQAHLQGFDGTTPKFGRMAA